MFGSRVLPVGTVLYHGTDCDEFDETADYLSGPAWVTSSLTVARRFASRSGGWGGQKRIVQYVLSEVVELPEIFTPREMAAFVEEHSLDMCGVESMRDSVERAGLPGWILPYNYPDGDDILLVATHILDYQATLPV